MRYSINDGKHIWFSLTFEAAIALSKMLQRSHTIKQSQDCMFGVEECELAAKFENDTITYSYKQFVSILSDYSLYNYYVSLNSVNKGIVSCSALLIVDENIVVDNNFDIKKFIDCDYDDKEIYEIYFDIVDEVDGKIKYKRVAYIKNGTLTIEKRSEDIIAKIMDTYKMYKSYTEELSET